MKNRPLSVTIIALLYFLEPLAGLAVAARISHLPIWGAEGLMASLSWLDWLALSLFPAAAIGIYSVRRWGWYLFVTISTFLVGYSIWLHLSVNPFYGNSLAPIFALATTAACASVFRRHVYSPYFNPRLRWWETADRYRVNLSLRLFTCNGEVDAATLSDVSITGCFVKVPQPLKIGERVWVVVTCAGTELSCLGRTVRKGNNVATGHGYGIMFGAIPPATRYRLKRLIRALEHLGGLDRQGTVPEARIPVGFDRNPLAPFMVPALMRLLRPAVPFHKSA